MAPVCASGKQSIMYAWAKDAGELTMPKGSLSRNARITQSDGSVRKIYLTYLYEFALYRESL